MDKKTLHPPMFKINKNTLVREITGGSEQHAEAFIPSTIVLAKLTHQ
jgi:hypothetical protein